MEIFNNNQTWIYIFGYIFIVAGVIRSSNELDIEIVYTNKKSAFGILNLGKISSISLFFIGMYKRTWWLPLLTTLIGFPVGLFIYYIADKLGMRFINNFLIILGTLLCLVGLSH